MACNTLKENLAPYQAKHPTWQDAVTAAMADGVALAAYGQYQAARRTR